MSTTQRREGQARRQCPGPISPPRESYQRLINETYSAFVQGFMPTLARPEVDVLEGLTLLRRATWVQHGWRLRPTIRNG
jgi:hypothetical protein